MELPQFILFFSHSLEQKKKFYVITMPLLLLSKNELLLFLQIMIEDRRLNLVGMDNLFRSNQ